jgi:hypothetical protein
MDILAQRKSVGTLTGQLLIAGRPAGRGFIRRTAYVPQEDNFVPTMTTMETMRFYAAIILPDEMGRAGRLRRVEEVLAAVGLGGHHKTLVGGVLPGGLMLRGLSGGERKRLSIAAGILAAPSVVFLDEPTSGLDSFAALTVGRAGGARAQRALAGGPPPGTPPPHPEPPPARLRPAPCSTSGRGWTNAAPRLDQRLALSLDLTSMPRTILPHPTPLPGHGLHEKDGACQWAGGHCVHPPAALGDLDHV